MERCDEAAVEPTPIRTAKEIGMRIVNEFNPADQNAVIKQIFNTVLVERGELINLKTAELEVLKKTFDELLILNT